MKKLFALVLALMLALSASVSLANELNWADAEAQVASIEADFYTFEDIGLKMWVPAVLKPTELSDSDVEAGYIAFFQTEDETDAVGVQCFATEAASLEDLGASLESIGASNIEYGTLNGLPCVTWDLTEFDSSYVSFLTENGFALQFGFAPMSDAGFAATAMFMVCSIQAAE